MRQATQKRMLVLQRPNRAAGLRRPPGPQLSTVLSNAKSALWFIRILVAAGDIALSRMYGEAAPLRLGRFCGGGRHFGVRGFRGGSGRRPRLDCSGRRPVSWVHIDEVFDFTGIFQPELAALRAGVRDLSGSIRTFKDLSRKLSRQ